MGIKGLIAVTIHSDYAPRNLLSRSEFATRCNLQKTTTSSDPIKKKRMQESGENTALVATDKQVLQLTFDGVGQLGQSALPLLTPWQPVGPLCESN